MPAKTPVFSTFAPVSLAMIADCRGPENPATRRVFRRQLLRLGFGKHGPRRSLHSRAQLFEGNKRESFAFGTAADFCAAATPLVRAIATVMRRTLAKLFIKNNLYF